MTREEYNVIDAYMQECMADSAHDKEHVYRVLYTALDIAEYETDFSMDILIAACLLHDIGRKEQIEDGSLCHASVGSKKAYEFLLSLGWEEIFARHVSECILTHRFRSDNPPVSTEAKILFDADKIDVCGAMGIARSLVYRGAVTEPLYTLNADGTVCDGEFTDEPSFFREYHFKLKKLYGRFFTKRGTEIGRERREAAEAFYLALLKEARNSYDDSIKRLENALNN